MSSLNQVFLMGNLTRNPQLKFLPSQVPVCEFGIAMNKKWKTQGGEEREEVTFVDVSAFGKTAEIINTHFTKGKPILLQGRLKFDSWEDKNGGGKRSKLSVVLDTFRFVGAPSDGGSRGGGEQRQRESAPQQPFGDEMQFKEADIPF